MRSKPVLLVLSAPSGAGKTTLMDGLLADNPSLRRAVTCTTRTPRNGERDGVDYHFLSCEAFEARVRHGDFLEHAEVYGNRYGTLWESVRAELNGDNDVLVSLDVQGVASVQAAAKTDPSLRSALVTVFVTTESVAELERRLRGRGSDTDEALARRLATARHEMTESRRFDYVVVSGSREEDRRRVQAIYDAEKLRQSRSGFLPPK